MSASQPTIQEYQIKEDQQPPANWSQQTCEDIPPSYVQNRNSNQPSNREPKPAEQQAVENNQQPNMEANQQPNMEANQVEENNQVQDKVPAVVTESLCGFKTVAIFVLVLALATTNIIHLFSLYAKTDIGKLNPDVEIVRLQQEIKGLNKDIKRYEEDKLKLETERNELKTKLEATQKVLDNRNMEFHKLEGQHEQLDTGKNQIIQDLRNEKSKLTEEIQKASENVGDQSRLLATKEQTVKELELEKLALEKDKTRFFDEKNRAENELEVTKTTLALTQKTHKESRDDMIDREHKCEMNKKEIEVEQKQTIEHNTNLKSELSANEVKFEHMRTDRDEYKQLFTGKVLDTYSLTNTAVVNGMQQCVEEKVVLKAENEKHKNALLTVQREASKSECQGYVCQAIKSVADTILD